MSLSVSTLVGLNPPVFFDDVGAGAGSFSDGRTSAGGGVDSVVVISVGGGKGGVVTATSGSVKLSYIGLLKLVGRFPLFMFSSLSNVSWVTRNNTVSIYISL